MSKQPTRLLRFPLVQVLEDKILLQSWHRDALPPGAEELIDLVSQDVFGNTHQDTEDALGAIIAASDGWNDEDAGSIAHLAALFYETDDLSDEEVVAYFVTRGLDFRNERGQPLRSTVFLARQAEAACRGIVGQVPAENDADARNWADQLQRDAEAFMKKKTG